MTTIKDLQVSMGPWKWSPEGQSPPWHTLFKANVWSHKGFAPLRAALSTKPLAYETTSSDGVMSVTPRHVSAVHFLLVSRALFVILSTVVSWVM